MHKVQIPHKEPIHFAHKIIYTKEKNAKVSVSFDQLPSLPMMIESAAQSSAALDLNSSKKEGFLVAMKNIVLIQKPTKKFLEVNVTLLHSLEKMRLIDFQVFEDKLLLASGHLTIKTSP